MLAFEVVIDGTHVATAGVDNCSQLSVIIAAGRGGLHPDTDYHCSIGALLQVAVPKEYHHARWATPTIGPGSEIIVRVIETAHVDPPTKIYRSDAAVQESPYTEDELRELRRQDYFALKKEFDPQNVTE
jgi:hypothetical protein